MTDSATVRTTCPYCGVGCGIVATVDNSALVNVQGDPEHPSNFGRLCSKGSALADTVGLENRLLFPMIRGERVDWSTALTAVADGFKKIIDNYGPDAVAFYVSGQLLTEDYYVANKLMKGFIGSANIDTNSRLCMASSVAGHKRAFGSDTVPGCYEDLELADLIVLVGSNTAWCHPVIFQRISRAQEQRPALKIVVIDPRKTATCEIADLHLSLAPGTDTMLWNGLLTYLKRNDHINFDFLEIATEGYAQALQVAQDTAPSIPAVAGICGLEEADVATFFNWFARTERVVSAYSQGVNQSSAGTDKVNAIINCHLLTGRIGKPGMGPFSLTGQPNAMGGREVGGLANQLAVHMDIENSQHRDIVQRFWRAPALAAKPGLKAVDMFQAIGEGRIKAVWIMATNPAVSMPDANAVRTALRRCELVVVSDCVTNTDTTAVAHVLLPAAAWGEKDGTVTNSERRISRQRQFLPLPGEAKPDWWIIGEVAKKMGFAADFAYTSAAAIFREHAALSGYENESRRDFDISAYTAINDDQYNALQPFQWPATSIAPQGRARMFDDGLFFTPSRKARFMPITPRLPQHRPNEEYPFILNTGRIRDQWHTMTRTAKSSRLSMHIIEPYAELHTADSQRLNLPDGNLIRLSSRWGSMVARVKASDEQRPGNVFVPIHWNDQFAANGCIDKVVNPVVDPISGEPEFKHTPVKIEPYAARWYGFLLTRQPLVKALDTDYWVQVRGGVFWRYELAGEEPRSNWEQWLHLHVSTSPQSEWLEYSDNKGGRYRGVQLTANRLDACLFIAPTVDLPAREWLAGLFAKETISVSERAQLLAGRPGTQQQSGGTVVCSCFGVGRNTILNAVREQNLASVQAIGQALKAGTNCGSCIPELKQLLDRAKH